MPKAIKKKFNNDFSSPGFSVELTVETEVLEESETATGVETASFALSAFATISVVVAITAVFCYQSKTSHSHCAERGR